MAQDLMRYHSPAAAGPVSSAAAVTPSDDTDLTYVTRALYVGTSGNLRVTMQDGQTVTFSSVPVGWHPLRVSRVLSTSTKVRPAQAVSTARAANV